MQFPFRYLLTDIMQRLKTSDRASFKSELKDLIRGLSGGFLFGIPLLYTMEVWWIGSSAGPLRLFVAIILTFSILFLLNQTSGFRGSANVRLRDAAMDSVEAFALGLVCTTIVLVLFQEITLDSPLGEALGKLIYEGVPFSLGVSLANQFLKDDVEQQNAQSDERFDHKKRNAYGGILSDLGATFVGAMIIGFSIAPTDEVPMLVASAFGPWLLSLVFASLLISYAIVFEADFSNQQKRQAQEGLFQDPFSETIVSYLVSLLAAASMLYFFDKLTFSDPWQTWLSYIIVLGLPSTVGGAAGRLAI